VGKSSLLNALTGEDRAIVTEIPGTTRDLVRADLDLDGLPVEIVDTAGLRDSTDPVEREGVRRAEDHARKADLVLAISEFKESNECSVAPPASTGEAAVIVVINKVDITDLEPGQITTAAGAAGPPTVRVSALTGAGIGDLRQAMLNAVGFSNQAGTFTARLRHLFALEDGLAALECAGQLLTSGAAGELIAEELRAVHQALGSIVGEISADDLLGEIFASFCIGK